MDKVTGVKVNPNLSVKDLLSFWIFGKVSTKNNISSNKCIYYQMNFDKCVKENQDCKELFEMLAQCKRNKL